MCCWSAVGDSSPGEPRRGPCPPAAGQQWGTAPPGALQRAVSTCCWSAVEGQLPREPRRGPCPRAAGQQWGTAPPGAPQRAVSMCCWSALGGSSPGSPAEGRVHVLLVSSWAAPPGAPQRTVSTCCWSAVGGGAAPLGAPLTLGLCCFWCQFATRRPGCPMGRARGRRSASCSRTPSSWLQTSLALR